MVMDRYEWLNLDRDYACTACVAYVAWRHAHEGGAKAPIYRDTYANPYTYKNRMPGASFRQRGAVATNVASKILYADYLRLLMALEAEDLRGQLRIVVRANERLMPTTVAEMRSVPLPSTIISVSGDTPEVVESKVIVPDGMFLAQRAKERCDARNKHLWAMCGECSPFGFTSQSALLDMTGDILFKLRVFERWTRRSYATLSI
ncbi:hypothetical protein BZM26_00060 [Paraburkholderia strydomiana]|nr:hypothetical protein BZM26_00060 [Paraburkholderia strydomiana]